MRTVYRWPNIYLLQKPRTSSIGGFYLLKKCRSTYFEALNCSLIRRATLFFLLFLNKCYFVLRSWSVHYILVTCIFFLSVLWQSNQLYSFRTNYNQTGFSLNVILDSRTANVSSDWHAYRLQYPWMYFVRTFKIGRIKNFEAKRKQLLERKKITEMPG